jgi:hypothetical protein
MSSPSRMSRWLRQLLPTAGRSAQDAAAQLVGALLVQFTTQLAQLARQADRPTQARVSRQFFARWLSRPHWDPPTIYAHLNRSARRVLGRRQHGALLIDFTYLKQRWAVLQVSVPWQGRALPLYRAVYRRADPEVGQTHAVREACAFLRVHLPGPHARYLLVMDRGFPSHPLVRELTQAGWRFVLRVNSTWKMTHPELTGQLRDLRAAWDPRGSCPRLFPLAVLGNRDKGRDHWSVANVVCFHGVGYREPWWLVTTEARAARAVAIYRQRMQIECEFKDLKGAWGLDELATWQDRERVARFLALVAIYEWRLADLWRRHRLHEKAKWFTVYGKLSWIRLTREWIQSQLRPAAKQLLDSL